MGVLKIFSAVHKMTRYLLIYYRISFAFVKYELTWSNRYITIFNTTSGRLNHRLLKVAVGGPEECNRQITGGCGGHGGQLVTKLEDGVLFDGLFPAKWRVHVQTAEIFP